MAKADLKKEAKMMEESLKNRRRKISPKDEAEAKRILKSVRLEAKSERTNPGTVAKKIKLDEKAVKRESMNAYADRMKAKNKKKGK